ncbi:MAG: hypothetical protein DWH82_09240 [Planctomycetota bacterium]|nr:MAG: hypothetical protein DWH82_09240 [Planctomycetota bacterium]
MIVCFGIIQVDGHHTFYRRVRSPPKCQRWGGQERGRQTRECSLDHLGKIDDFCLVRPICRQKKVKCQIWLGSNCWFPQDQFQSVMLWLLQGKPGKKRA